MRQFGELKPKGLNLASVGHLLVKLNNVSQNCCEKIVKFCQKTQMLVKARRYCKSKQMMKNEYELATIGFDTTENEPSKVMFLYFDIPQISKSVHLAVLVQRPVSSAKYW